jgi:hypothetical protein
VIHDDGLGLPFLRPGNCVRRLVGVSQLNPSASDTREDTRPTNPVVCLPETQVVNEMQHSGSCQSRNVALAWDLFSKSRDGLAPSNVSRNDRQSLPSNTAETCRSSRPRATPLSCSHLNSLPNQFGLESSAQDSRRRICRATYSAGEVFVGRFCQNSSFRSKSF